MTSSNSISCFRLQFSFVCSLSRASSLHVAFFSLWAIADDTVRLSSNVIVVVTISNRVPGWDVNGWIGAEWRDAFVV